MNQIIFSSWGGEVVDNREKDIQSFSPVSIIELPENFKQDTKIKALIGWYGIVIRSEGVDILDLCRAYMAAVHKHSCGRCIPCPTGTGIMVDMLEKLCRGQGSPEDIDTLKGLAEMVSSTSKCSIGQSGPLPILDALKYFPDRFDSAVSNQDTCQP
ncbi:MAG: formate dehydrogenase, partial [Deltaproteobacteria bacterium]|nr:formate dehydrogenase [Deltaproteobacteria bacterium]